MGIIYPTLGVDHRWKNFVGRANRLLGPDSGKGHAEIEKIVRNEQEATMVTQTVLGSLVSCRACADLIHPTAESPFWAPFLATKPRMSPQDSSFLSPGRGRVIEVDRFLEPSIPSNETREKFSLNTNQLSIQNQNTITFFEVVFCANEQCLSFGERTLYATKSSYAMNMPTLA